MTTTESQITSGKAESTIDTNEFWNLVADSMTSGIDISEPSKRLISFIEAVREKDREEAFKAGYMKAASLTDTRPSPFILQAPDLSKLTRYKPNEILTTRRYNDVEFLAFEDLQALLSPAQQEPDTLEANDKIDYKRMFEDAASSLAVIDAALGIDPDECGGAGPILAAIAALRVERDQWVDAQYSDSGECKSCINGQCTTGNECVALGLDSLSDEDELPGLLEPADVSGGETDQEAASATDAGRKGTLFGLDKETIIQRAMEHGMDLDMNPVAYEFRNFKTGHAIVDYSRNTHVGYLAEKDGYVARPLTYADATPAQATPEGGLPPLPKAKFGFPSLSEDGFNADQMREYARSSVLASQKTSEKCPDCGGTGERDSGGVHPWGEAINVPCDCMDTLFKNFHRSLCARFNYRHDEKDWKRDLLSLEEHIATFVKQTKIDKFPSLPEPLLQVWALVPHPNGAIGRVIRELVTTEDELFTADQMLDAWRAARATPAQATPEGGHIKTWRERAKESGQDALTADQCLKLAEAEIKDLRATLAAKQQEAETDPHQLFERKLANLQQRGYKIIGHILHNDGQYALFDLSCRWLTQPQYWRLMHEQDGSLFADRAAPLQQGGGITIATDAKKD